MAIHTPEMTATETVPADTETAVATLADAEPLTAPDTPDTAALDADPATDADGRMAAVWAALNAEPGGSATAIGAAAGLSRMAAGKILNQFAANGRARREPGTNDGSTRGRTSDCWYPVTVDTSVLDTETPDAAPAVPDADTPGADTASTPNEEALPAATDSTAPCQMEKPIEEADGQPEVLSADAAIGEGPQRTDGQLASAPDADASEAGPVPMSQPVADDPAWAQVRTELMELVDLFGGVTLAKANGNDVMALGCLEMAMAKVASVHRNARAALTGTAAAPARPASAARPGTVSGGVGGGVRPGALRDRVHAHLIEFPDKDFTPYEIGKVLDASSGAVANALDRLVSLGDAVLTCERPRRFALAPTDTPTGAPAEPGTHAETADDESTVETDTYGG